MLAELGFFCKKKKTETRQPEIKIRYGFMDQTLVWRTDMVDLSIWSPTTDLNFLMNSSRFMFLA
ncbi:hypothetical protein Hanom_Chr02g00154821 [Helianthus anomalus]